MPTLNNKPNLMRARSLAKKLLREAKIIKPPIKLSDVSNHLGFQTIGITPQILKIKKNISAVVDLESKILLYNTENSTVRNRFSVAHEIGHFLLKHRFGTMNLFNLSSKDVREIEANMFAAELLIPFDWVKNDLRDEMDVEKLAWKYWVSKDAMWWRISKSDSLLLNL